ncbi:MAG: CDP-alcohol phosphatidyltransferase family protein [Saprospiraceae bacterium]|nr:CDP-alcohol phosphatidyltransferase family protein [Saprospiraceae bacterium]
MNLACGFLAIITADYYQSSIFLLFSLVFDLLDGFAARKLNAQSELGRELDSLADLTSFGVAPAYLYYLLRPIEGIWAMIPPVILVLGSAVRLAKFNLLPPSPYFSGLPTPATAMFMIGLFLGVKYESNLIVSILENPYLYCLIPVFFSAMMLSTVRMFSLKGFNKGMRQNKLQLFLLLILISLLLVDNKLAAPVTILLYILLSLIQSLSNKA